MLLFILVASSYFIAGVSGLTSAQQSIASDSHNNYRSQLAKGQSVDNKNVTMPQGKNIYQLIYNQTLENSAQLWANNCSWKHSGSGENMLAISANVSPEAALSDASKSWWSELAQYGMNHDLNLTQAEFEKGVGHWSQMAWGKTTLLGCGVAWCPNGAPPIPWPAATIIVCHYREPGNFINGKIYEAGSPCTKNADCTTFPNSVCNVAMGLCSTVPLPSIPNTTVAPTATTTTLKLATTSTSTIKPLTTTTQPASSTTKPVTTAPPQFTPLTAAEKSIAMDSHNTYRSQLAKGQALDNKNVAMPQGKNIYQLTYNQTLEASAQAWANSCNFGASRVGENLYAYSVKASFETVLKEATKSWWSELARLGMNQQLNFTQAEAAKTVGHWSQMAWGKTTLLGCAMTWCPNGAPPLNWPNVTILVCHYAQVGNYLNQVVYEAGSPCTKNTDCTTYPNSYCNGITQLCFTTG